jgi:hypothetical protein
MQNEEFTLTKKGARPHDIDGKPTSSLSLPRKEVVAGSACLDSEMNMEVKQ